MTRRAPTAIAIPLLLLSTSALLTGCWSSGETELEPKELKKKNETTVDAPEATLFDSGKKLFAADLFTVSKETFDSLRANYPLSPYAEFAAIKAADAQFEAGEYESAAAAYEEFAKNHPGSSSLPYTLMRAGRSYQRSHRGIGRDKTNLEKALEVYERLMKRYPDSLYARTAVDFRQEVIENLAEHERFVMDFYERRDHDKAVAARRAQFNQRWQPLLDQNAPPPITIVESVRRPVEPAPVPEVVAIERTGSAAAPPAGPDPGAALQPPGAEDTTDAALPVEQQGSLPLEQDSSRTIRAVRCDREPPLAITIELSRPLASDDDLRWTMEDDTTLVLALAGTTGGVERMDCFGTGDLSVTADGTVRVKRDAPVHAIEAFPLSRPPRLVVFFSETPPRG